MNSEGKTRLGVEGVRVEHFGISEAKVGLGDDAACGRIFPENHFL